MSVGLLEVPKGVPVTVDLGVACLESGVLLRGVTRDPRLEVLDLWGVLISAGVVSALSLSLNAASLDAVAVFTCNQSKLPCCKGKVQYLTICCYLTGSLRQVLIKSLLDMRKSI